MLQITKKKVISGMYLFIIRSTCLGLDTFLSVPCSIFKNLVFHSLLCFTKTKEQVFLSLLCSLSLSLILFQNALTFFPSPESFLLFLSALPTFFQFQTMTYFKFHVSVLSLPKSCLLRLLAHFSSP